MCQTEFGLAVGRQPLPRVETMCQTEFGLARQRQVACDVERRGFIPVASGDRQRADAGGAQMESGRSSAGREWRPSKRWGVVPAASGDRPSTPASVWRARVERQGVIPAASGDRRAAGYRPCCEWRPSSRGVSSLLRVETVGAAGLSLARLETVGAYRSQPWRVIWSRGAHPLCRTS